MAEGALPVNSDEAFINSAGLFDTLQPVLLSSPRTDWPAGGGGVIDMAVDISSELAFAPEDESYARGRRPRRGRPAFA